MDTKFSKDALFAGMTGNAFKLGTVLSLGWFWQRVAGCNLLYRGESMREVDFGRILAVSGLRSGKIAPVDYVGHEKGKCYFYVLRRVNCCGREERSFCGSVKFCLDENGEVVQPGPNHVFALKAHQIEGDRVKLVWFYKALQQGEKPLGFRIYSDGGGGEVDFENAVGELPYRGPRSYVSETGSLGAGSFIFAVKALGSQTGDTCTQVSIDIDTTEPEEVEIQGVRAC